MAWSTTWNPDEHGAQRQGLATQANEPASRLAQRIGPDLLLVEQPLLHFVQFGAEFVQYERN